MIVYRVEDSDGYGPYGLSRQMAAIDNRFYWRLARAHADPQHPCPFNEGEPWESAYHTDEKFAFLSLERLEEWFDTFLLEIFSYGVFSVVMYEVEEKLIRVGNSGQVCFNSKFATFAGFVPKYKNSTLDNRTVG